MNTATMRLMNGAWWRRARNFARVGAFGDVQLGGGFSLLASSAIAPSNRRAGRR